MTSDQVVTIFVALIGAVGVSLVTGLLSRPKTKAEASTTKANGEVAISGDAREWAREFATRAQRAEEKAIEAEKRCDDIENKLNAATSHIRDQQQAIIALGGHPPPVPAILIPPLS